jgi:hypothetical protein
MERLGNSFLKRPIAQVISQRPLRMSPNAAQHFNGRCDVQFVGHSSLHL